MKCSIKRGNPRLIRRYVLKTRFGWSEVSLSSKGLLLFRQPQEEEIEGYRYRELEEMMERYFSGERVDFSSFPLDLSLLSPFQRAVLEEVRRLKWGELTSYEEIGKRLGKKEKARAVGQALARNPLPIIIPCHRVIPKGGGLGGFSWGLEWKRRLLRLESSL